jgi:hypothetical protein
MTQQNVKLMLEGLKVPQLVTDSDTHHTSHHHNLAVTICNPCTKDSFFNGHKECPATSKAKDLF